MTRGFNHIPTETSRINSAIIGTLASAMVVLAGLLSFAPYSL